MVKKTFSICFPVTIHWSELMQPNIVTDRTIIDVMAFTNKARKVSYIDGDAFEIYAKRFLYQYDYIFYVSPEGVNMEDNGVRETDLEYRNDIDQEIQKLLHKHRPIWYTISGSTEERVKQVLNTVTF